MSDLQATLYNSLQRFDKLLETLKPDDATYPAWRQKANEEFRIWRGLKQEIRTITAPERFALAHARYTETLDMLSAFTDDFNRLLDRRDRASYDKSIENLKHAGEAYRAAEREWDTALGVVNQ